MHKDDKLAQELAIWFKNNQDKADKWNRTVVGKLLKAELSLLGNWKNAERGNPSLGAKARKAKITR